MSYTDSRDLIERRDALLEEKGVADLDDDDDDDVSAELLDAVGKLNGFTEEQQDELNALEDAISEIGETYAIDGVSLIPESEFVEYAEQLCKENGYVDKNIPWWIVIDWDATANNIRQDYSEVEFEGETYLYQV